MKKITSFAIILFLGIGLGFAQTTGIVSGAIYTLKSKSSSKLLTVQNSSQSNDANVETWTNAQSDAQRWVVTYVGNNLYTVANVGSDKFLHTANVTPANGVNVDQHENTNDYTVMWKIVNEGNGYFSLQNATNNNFVLDLNSALNADGANVGIYTSNGTDAQRWLFEQQTTQDVAPTAAIRDNVFQSWQNKYYKQASTGYVLGSAGFWGIAEMMEILLDAYETTGHGKYKDMFNNVYDNFYATQGDGNGNWMSNEYNDDIAWIVLACTRAYLMFGTQKYLTIAKSHYDQMYARAYLSSIGLLRWKENNGDGTTSCVNGPAEIAACYLAVATGDNSYYTKAKNLYANQRILLYESDKGKVWDNPGSNWSSTYNQGTYLGAAVMLYNYYGDAMYLEDAKKIAQFTKDNLCNNEGVINVETGGSDLPGFKGILMRYLRRFIVDLRQPDYIPWLKTNAKVAYNNRNSEGIIWTAWANKSAEGTDYDVFGASTAVSLLANCPLNSKLVVKDAYSKIEAEDFDYISGPIAETCTADGGGENLGGIQNGYYVGYMNVDFGTHVATSAEFRVSNSTNAGSIEVRVGSPTGALIGTATIPPGSGWGTYTTVKCDISSVFGLKNIYLVFKGTSYFSNLNYFKFNIESAFCPDITDNGGVLTSSHAATFTYQGLSNLIDNKANSKFYSYVGVNPGTIWFQYKSPMAVTLKGYALASADDQATRDPKNWKLQASNDGNQWVDISTQTDQIFDKRWLKKTYNVTTSTAYTYFRLYITARQGEGSVADFQLGEWQLFGTGLHSNDITNDGGVLSAQYVGNGPNETIVKLTDHSATSKYLVKDHTSLWTIYKGISRYRLTSYSLTSANDEAPRDMKSWTLYGSNDSINWTVIDEERCQFFPYRYSTQTYKCSTDAGFQYFKLAITENSGATMTQVAELQLIGDVYMDDNYLDITDNGGILTSSQNGQDGTTVENVLDEKGNTTFKTSTSSRVWIQYQTPIATKLKNYTISVADNQAWDPKSWKLQGSNDGVSWTDIDARTDIVFGARYLKKNFSVSSSNKYNFFRLQINGTYDTQSSTVQIAEWELFGSAITKDITDDGGTLIAQYDGNTGETYANLTDNSETTKYYIPTQSTVWMQYQSTRPVSLLSYSLTSANDYPTRDYRSWNLYASTNGTNWDLIDTQVDQVFPYRYCTQFYSCKTEKKYSYFKLDVIKNNDASSIQISEWQLFGNYGNYYPDITANGGTLTSSHAAGNNLEGLSNLTDDKESTKFYSSVGTTMPSVWIQYQSPLSVSLKSYAITSANDSQNRDPKSWKLQGSNDGTVWVDLDTQTDISFANRYEQQVFTVSTSSLYTYFRLFVTARNADTDSGFQFAEWELYGTAIASSDLTDNGGLLTGQYPGNQTSQYNETLDKLTDNSSTSKYLVKDCSQLWVQYQSTSLAKLNSYSITSANDDATRDIKSWTLYGSTNGTDWTAIDNQLNQLFATRYSTQTYYCPTDSLYNYFKLNVTANNGSTMIQIGDWQLFGDSQSASAIRKKDNTEDKYVKKIIGIDSTEVKIFPNPAKETINITAQDMDIEANYVIWNTLGIPVLSGAMENCTIDVSKLQKGMYIVKFKQAGALSTGCFVKQ